jgi:MFS family permease
MPIIFLFYNENGLTTSDLFIIQASYSLTIVIAEVPSGYLADLFGRKSIIIAGSILGFTGYLIYTVSHNFWGFLLAEIILGIGQSMISGADSALLYDSLAKQGRKDKYMMYEGRMTSVGNFAEATAGVIGGLLGAVSLRFPYYGQAAIAFLSIPASLALIEPTIHKINNSEKLSYFWKIIHYSLVENKILRWNIVLSAVIGSSTLAMAWFVQPYFKQINIPVSIYGILWTVLNFSVGLSALFAYRFEKKLGQVNSVILIAIGISAGFWIVGVSNSILGLVTILIFYLLRGIATPVLKDYINKITTSEMRATVLSIRSLLIRLLFASIAPMFGWLADKYSLSAALLISGTIFFLLSATTIYFYLKAKKKAK